MITRGHYLGEIIDDLSTLASQVKMRNAIGLTDLTVYAENFFRDILNILLGASLVNLNSERSNAPGLDLGDKNLELAFQITSSATTAKVNKTLEKITAANAAIYKKIIVLGMNKKQSSYSLDEVLAPQYGFSKDNIWDLDTIARKAVSLELGPLQDLHRLIRNDSARLKVELEVPDSEGKYPTSGYEFWEERVKPRVGEGSSFSDFWEEQSGNVLAIKEKEQLAKSLKQLGIRLSRLPRLTREFLAMLYERRERGRSKRFKDEWQHLLLSKVQREYRGDDLYGELGVLEHAEFIRVDGEDAYEQGPTEIGLRIPGSSEELTLGFVNYVVEKKLGFRNVIGSIDLSAF